MPTPIAEDFAAIRARLDALRAEALAAATAADPPAPVPVAGPSDFFTWMFGPRTHGAATRWLTWDRAGVLPCGMTGRLS